MPFETIEQLRENGTWMRYRPRVVRSQTPNTITYKLRYEAKDHPEYSRLEDTYWGISAIKIAKDLSSVEAFWEDYRGTEMSGPGSASLTDEGQRQRTSAFPTIRNQTQLRSLLLATDEECAITGEKTQCAIECAHLLDVKHGGFEVDENAILMRADLHCLFDSNGFKILPDGRVIPGRSLSPYYVKLLTGKRLSLELTNRVGASLAKRHAALAE